jgi:hypothetical protein
MSLAEIIPTKNPDTGLKLVRTLISKLANDYPNVSVTLPASINCVLKTLGNSITDIRDYI